MPYIGTLQAAGLAKETTPGTLVTPPTEFLPLIAPDSFTEAIDLLESKGIRGLPDSIVKVAQGPATLKSGKIKIECEPENCGNILMGAFGTDTKSGSGTAGYTHLFTRASVSQLPTYSFWFKKGPKYFQFTGCMLNKLVMAIKAKEFVTLDADYVGLKYDDTGSSQSAVYNARKPFTFANAVVQIDGSQVNDYESIQVTIDNMVEADHALANSIYPTKIASKGMKVTVAMSMYLENTTQWNKFLNGTSARVQVALTSPETIAGSTGPVAYSLALDVPTLNYNAAPLNIETGMMKVNFTGTAWYDPVTSKTISMSLVNSVSTAY